MNKTSPSLTEMAIMITLRFVVRVVVSLFGRSDTASVWESVVCSN